MSDPFHTAIAATLPALKSLQRGLKAPPRASASALAELRAVRKAAGQRRPEVPPVAHFESLDALRTAALACTKCPHLVRSRTQVVVGTGNPHAELMLVGEAPGADEDEQGEPFVGKAGQLLTKIIEAMDFNRTDIYIANVLKCRPDMPAGESGNRKPKPEEMATCLPWLREQIRLVKPAAIVALGATAVEGLTGTTGALMRDLRGQWLDFEGTPLMVTYHPSYLLRNQSITEKRKVWEDMLLVLEKLGKPISDKQRRFFTQPAA